MVLVPVYMNSMMQIIVHICHQLHTRQKVRPDQAKATSKHVYCYQYTEGGNWRAVRQFEGAPALLQVKLYCMEERLYTRDRW